MQPPGNEDRHNGRATDEPDAVGQVLDGWLRAQPLRRAPPSLQLQVMAIIERREHLRLQGFRRWSPAVRVGFMVLACVMAKLAVDVLLLLLNSMRAVDVPQAPLATALLETLVAISEHMPLLWLYGGIAVLVMVYGGLFGLGTAVYRTLYLQR